MSGYYEEIVDFMRALLGSALKDNIYLEKAIITGITRVAKESFFSGLNNLQTNTLMDPKYGQYFGFTLEETLDSHLTFFKVKDQKSSIWTLLLHTGYLTIESSYLDERRIAFHGKEVSIQHSLSLGGGQNVSPPPRKGDFFNFYLWYFYVLKMREYPDYYHLNLPSH